MEQNKTSLPPIRLRLSWENELKACQLQMHHKDKWLGICFCRPGDLLVYGMANAQVRCHVVNKVFELAFEENNGHVQYNGHMVLEVPDMDTLELRNNPKGE